MTTQTTMPVRKTDNLPATIEADNLLDAAKEHAGFEKILKFKKGEYFVGEESVAIGTEYLAHAAAWTKCWIKFLGGEVTDRKLYRVARGERPPEREDLDDTDKAAWPAGLDGHPADPWVLQYLLPLENLSTGEIAVFATSSIGGKRAVADLCDAYARRTKKGNVGQPIVRLRTKKMPTKNFGDVPRPLFEVVGWDEVTTGGIPEEPPAADENEFQDKIPF
jgi:hypothetical protein